jgi:hypothetical protein
MQVGGLRELAWASYVQLFAHGFSIDKPIYAVRCFAPVLLLSQIKFQKQQSFVHARALSTGIGKGS